MNRERLDRGCERGILGLILGILIFGPLAYGAVRTSEFVFIQGAVVVVLLLWILRLWINPRPVFFWPPICWAVLAFVIYAMIRYRFAPIEYMARLELIKVLTYAFIFVAIVNNLSRQESTQVISIALVCLAFALSIFAIYQFITHSTHVWGMIKPAGYVLRGSGTFINPNIFAGFLELILPLTLTYTLLGRYGHASKVAFGYAALVMVIGIGSTLSRGGWIATGLTLAVLFLILALKRDFRVRSLIVLSLLLALGVGAIATTHPSKKRVEQLVSAEKVDDDRYRYWDSAVQLWREDIWIGNGPGHYDQRYRKYRVETLQGRPQFVHNDYLNTLVDWGIIGLGLIIIFLGLFYVGVFKTWRFVQRASTDLGTKSSNKAAFVLGGSLGVLSLMFHSVVDFNMHIPANAILVLTLIALVTTYLRFATENFWKSAGVFRRTVLSLIGVAGAVYLSDQGIRQFRENSLLIRATRADEFSDQKLLVLKKAFAVEPQNFETAYAIGEIYRGRATVGDSNYESLTEEAMGWFQRSIDLNPFYPFSYVRYGMCLHWLNRSDEAGKYFAKAHELDPNGYFTAAHQGWHLLQLGDHLGAKEQFQRSEHLMFNPIAESYLEIIEEKLNSSPTP